MNFLFIFISSILFALSFPPYSIWGLGFICFIPLFIALNHAKTLMQHCIYGFLFGVFYVYTCGYWLFYALMVHYEKSFDFTILFIGLLVQIPFGIIFGFFGSGFGILKKNHLVFYSVIMPSLWCMMEYLLEMIKYMIPWGLAGYTVLSVDPFIQIADIGGVHLISFIVMMINGILVYLLSNYHNQLHKSFHPKRVYQFLKTQKIAVFIVLVAFFLPYIYGIQRIETIEKYIQTSKFKYPIKIIQANFSQKERWEGDFTFRLNTYLGWSDCTNLNSSCLVIWPETVLNSVDHLNMDFFARLMAHIGPNSMLFTGGVRLADEQKNQYNSVYFISGQGQLSWYDKHILLPYAETAPVQNTLGTYYNAPSEFIPGQTPLTIQTSYGIAGISICFESLYSRFIRFAVHNEGAQFFVNVSNDSWFGKTSMPYHHFNASRIRAIETRRFLIRSSNSGISGIISPTGDIVDQTELYTRTALIGWFSPLSISTVYNQFGDWLLYMISSIIIISVCHNLLRD